ncbi:PH domain-containing protein [Candidatus Kaiserbacteria bacterium]|nr:PH domain-containing protein [Candidatus Kaiserbacteria bacterium]
MIHLQEGEHIDIKARKHWFMLFRDSAGIIIIYLLPFLAWELIQNDTGLSTFSLPEVSPVLLTFLGSAWTLFAWAWFFTAWTSHYLDIWIVTDRRIVDIDQKSLFHREISTLRMERVQDVTFEINGIVATVLNFGDVHVQTAGESEGFVIKGVAEPERIKNLMVKHIDKTVERGRAGI